MESLEKRYHAVIQTLATLQESLQILEGPERQQIYNVVRDSVIQRFEYSIDTFWKFLKIYLQDRQQVSFVLITPRAILKEAFNAGLLTETEFKTLVQSVSDRNLTSHTYNEELAQQIVKNISEYYVVMSQVIDRIPLKGD